ncbi:MAG: hypothetical protein CMG74_11520 [Candidatus Marinimicrobia bacterium]|nr:hypothetical protein [Candidatus Neomarinimicrobiota bacterium]|tara:strand:+ start:17435 stop:19210 length:1776 start_codon:yes stop_codon:yes gene_type:complete
MYKRKLYRQIISRFLISLLFLFVSCMNPIEEPPEQYSEYSEIIIFDPDNGVPNGNFENGLEKWKGEQYRWGNEWGSKTEFNIVDANDGHILDGSKALALTIQNGNARIGNYYNYSAGDTIVFSVNYMIQYQIESVDENYGFQMEFYYQGRDENNVIVNNGFKGDVFSPNASNLDSSLLSNGLWHEVKVSVIYNSADVNRASIGFGFTDNSQAIGLNRAITVYIDKCEIERKPLSNSSPSEFSILQPLDGDVFSLDTFKYFQTIRYEWEESYDSDTVLYTNRLVAKVPAQNLPISSGFEEVYHVENFNTVINDWEYYDMPAGYRFTWFQVNSDFNGNAWFPSENRTVWVTDSVSRSGNRSLRMGAVDRDEPQHYTSLGLHLSRVDNFRAKDRLAPGSVLTVQGYMMTPSDDKISGDNSAVIQLYGLGEDWVYELSPELNGSFVPDKWHQFSTEMIVPEQLNFPGTAWAGIIFRYHQVAGSLGTVYIDDVTISVSEPIRFFITYYYDRLTDVENTVMSAAYLNGLFDFMREDLAGISFNEVKLEWGILATDFITETYASNSPITITIIGENQENVQHTNLRKGDQGLIPDFLR